MQQFLSGLYLWGIPLLDQRSALCWLSAQLCFMQLSAAPREHTPNHGSKFRVFLFLRSPWLCVAHAFYYRLTGMPIWIFILTSGNSTWRCHVQVSSALILTAILLNQCGKVFSWWQLSFHSLKYCCAIFGPISILLLLREYVSFLFWSLHFFYLELCSAALFWWQTQLRGTQIFALPVGHSHLL